MEKCDVCKESKFVKHIDNPVFMEHIKCINCNAVYLVTYFENIDTGKRKACLIKKDIEEEHE